LEVGDLVFDNFWHFGSRRLGFRHRYVAPQILVVHFLSAASAALWRRGNCLQKQILVKDMLAFGSKAFFSLFPYFNTLAKAAVPLFFCEMLCSDWPQDCQIFLGTLYQKTEKVPK
jgi:hypothetical protein